MYDTSYGDIINQMVPNVQFELCTSCEIMQIYDKYATFTQF